MPTVFEHEGFRFFFYSNDHTPIHVHVRYAGGEAVFIVEESIELRESSGLKVSGLEIRFPVAKSPRLATASEAELRKIEISPFGLHWPDLDEDLSFAGLLRGDYGQQTQAGRNRVPVTD
jgi:hypothetical protein